MAIEFQRHLWTTDEYEAMVVAGILTKDHRVELLGGEIVEMAPIKPPHSSATDMLNMLFALRSGGVFTVRVQGPVRLDNRSEPQPDLTLLRHPPDHYRVVHPTPDDVILMVEVADSSVLRDRNLKMPFYARARVREVWLVDIPGDVVERFADSDGEVFRTVERVGRGAVLSVPDFPAVTLTVDEILGPGR